MIFRYQSKLNSQKKWPAPGLWSLTDASIRFKFFFPKLFGEGHATLTELKFVKCINNFFSFSQGFCLIQIEQADEADLQAAEQTDKHQLNHLSYRVGVRSYI